jgi:hypothetical protein
MGRASMGSTTQPIYDDGSLLYSVHYIYYTRFSNQFKFIILTSLYHLSFFLLYPCLSYTFILLPHPLSSQIFLAKSDTTKIN